MGAKAQVEFGFGGIKGGIKDLGDLRDALIGVEGAGKRLDASYKGLRKLWEDPAGAKGGWSNATRTSAAALKLAADIAKTQASAASNAIIGPGKTTYDQALTSYRNYRHEVQRMATATGESFGSVDKRISETSKRLGLLPGQVQAYGAAIRNETGGTIEDALSGIDAARNRALKTGQSIEAIVGPMTALRQTFGIKSTQEVNQFFGAFDQQAKSAKISAEVASQAFMSSIGMLSRISSAGPRAMSAFTTQVVGNSMQAGMTAEMGTENAGELSSFVRNKSFLLEKVLRKKGMLRAGEHILDRSGRLTEKGFGLGLQASKDIMGSFYGKKDPIDASMRAELSGEMSSSAYLQLNEFDFKKFQEQSRARAHAGNYNTGWMSSDAGRRQAAEAQKNRRDLDLGQTLIGAQDAAVGMGGGVRGIAMAASGQIFSGAVDVFAGAVDRMIGGLGKGSAGAASALGTAGGTAGGQMLSSMLGAGGATAVVAATLPIAIMGAIGYFGYKDVTKDKERIEEGHREAKERDINDAAAAREAGVSVSKYRSMRARGIVPTSEESLQVISAPSPLRTEGYTGPASIPWSEQNGGWVSNQIDAYPVPYGAGGGFGAEGIPWKSESGAAGNGGSISIQAEAQAHAEALSKVLTGKTLRVAIDQPLTAPVGQGSQQ